MASTPADERALVEDPHDDTVSAADESKRQAARAAIAERVENAPEPKHVPKSPKGLKVATPILHGRPGTPERRTYEVGEDAPEDLSAEQVARLVRLGCLVEEKPEADDLAKLKKDELLELAADASIDVPADATKADIVELLNEHADEEPET